MIKHIPLFYFISSKSAALQEFGGRTCNRNEKSGHKVLWLAHAAEEAIARATSLLIFSVTAAQRQEHQYCPFLTPEQKQDFESTHYRQNRVARLEHPVRKEHSCWSPEAGFNASALTPTPHRALVKLLVPRQ